MDSVVLQRLGLSLAIGFLVGVERGWKQREEAPGERAAGLRTFSLAGLLGGLASVLSQSMGGIAFAALALAFAGVFGLFMWRASAVDGELSVTGAIAGLAVFALGALAGAGEEVAAAAAGVATVVILAFKDALHQWLHALTWTEIRSALLILAMSFIALPVLPTGTVDPWNLFNAREIWLLTILIATASFAGYVSMRAMGARAGLAIGAAIGALVSSTVVTLDLARRVSAREVSAVSGSAGAAIANAVMLMRVGALTSLLAPQLVVYVAPALGAGLLAASLAAGGLYGLAGKFQSDPGHSGLKSPFELGMVLRFAALLAAISIVVELAARSLGPSAILPFAGVSGLIDVDAVVLAISRLASAPPSTLADAILLAVAADTIFKSAIALFVGNGRFGAMYALASAGALSAGVAARFLFQR